MTNPHRRLSQYLEEVVSEASGQNVKDIEEKKPTVQTNAYWMKIIVHYKNRSDNWYPVTRYEYETFTSAMHVSRISNIHQIRRASDRQVI